MFPDERRVINLRRQAEARLASGTSGGGSGVSGLAALAKALSSEETAGVDLNSLRFERSSGGLGAELSAPSIAQIDRLGKVLTDAGVSSRVLSASEEGGVAIAKLELRTQ